MKGLDPDILTEAIETAEHLEELLGTIEDYHRVPFAMRSLIAILEKIKKEEEGEVYSRDDYLADKADAIRKYGKDA